MKRILMLGAALFSTVVLLAGCVGDRKTPSDFEGIDDPAELSAAVDRYVAGFDADPQLMEDRYTYMVLVAYGCMAKHNLDPEKYWAAEDFPESEAVQRCGDQQLDLISANVLTIESVGKKSPSEYGKELVDQALSFAETYRNKGIASNPDKLLAWARMQGKVARIENENRHRASVPR
jgi:hypothetical protein